MYGLVDTTTNISNHLAMYCRNTADYEVLFQQHRSVAKSSWYDRYQSPKTTVATNSWCPVFLNFSNLVSQLSAFEVLSRLVSSFPFFLTSHAKLLCFVDFRETGYMFLLHLSCIHRHFTNLFPCHHLPTGYFPNKVPCPQLPSEFSYVPPECQHEQH